MPLFKSLTSPVKSFLQLALTFIPLIVLAIGFHSCHNNQVYRETRHISSDGWKPADSISFTFQVDDTLTPLNFYFNVRNTTRYSYQNLFFFITTKYPGGAFSRDTAECILAGIDGRWLGKGKGKVRDSKFLFRKEVRFHKTGEYTLIVNQAMREELLKGVSDIGLVIEKPEE
ncbi:MAG TPA: gliding motility lipoprotein GldH [Bacteroidales bacterium]|nr:gliding motility lipoprotein GldH [Bacteroidales bacterium]HPT02531.1 gliding motility lipoprotein GldH [Bacteroidales bacterium]